jgi:transcriptional regulator with XRE-family HTH domain
MKIAQEIKRLREQLGLTPSELALRADLTPAYISKLEKGEYESFSLKTGKALAKGFGMTLREFLEAIKFIDRNEDRPSSQLISQAFRSQGYSEKQIEKIKEYADFIKQQQN